MSFPINHNTVNEKAHGCTRGLSNKDPHYNSAGKQHPIQPSRKCYSIEINSPNREVDKFEYFLLLGFHFLGQNVNIQVFLNP